jgi:hypothetical protein
MTTGPVEGQRASSTGADRPDPVDPPGAPAGAAVGVDPEDWAASTGSSDERLLRERPPHW